jgi:glucose-6-phosphate isomerase
MIRDVVVIGRGVAVSALRFVYAALLRDEDAALASRFGMPDAGNRGTPFRLSSTSSGGPSHATARRMKFVSSVDPVAVAAAVSDLDPASTLVVSIALAGNEETGLATKILKSWLLQALGGTHRRTDSVLAKHMMLVTGNERIAAVINKPESVYLIPEHSRCEAFTTFTVASLLPLSIVFGWSVVEDFLAGAHDMDAHFVGTNPRHNLPVLTALADVWNDLFLQATARAIVPFTEALSDFPAFVGALESETCGLATERSGCGRSCSSMVVDGGLRGTHDRAFYQAGKIVNSEIVMTLDSQVKFNASRTIGTKSMDDVNAAQDALICSTFAHADELAFGYKASPSDAMSSSMSLGSMTKVDALEYSEGNRPSLLLLTGKLDAFACGQLIALSEHRAAVKAHIWGIDVFVREVGSSLRMYRTDLLKDHLAKLFSTAQPEDEDEEAEEKTLSLSTRTILGHYAGLMKGSRSKGVQ